MNNYHQKPLLGKLPLWTPNPAGIPAPIGAWVMNEGSGNMIFDISGNGNNGEKSGAPVWVSTKVGAGINCVGTDASYNCGNSNLFNFVSQDFTVAVRLIPKSGQVAYGVFISRGQYQVDGWYIQVDNSVARDGVLFTFQQAGVSQEIRVSNVLNVNQVCDCVFVRKGELGSIYIDGIETGYADRDAIVSPTTSTRNLYLGRYDSIETDFTGILIHTYIYHQALTQNQAIYLHQHPYYAWEYPNLWQYYVAEAAGGLSAPNPFNRPFAGPIGGPF